MRRTIRIIISIVSLLMGFVSTYFLIQSNFVKTLIPDFLVGSARYGVIAVSTLLFGFIFYLFFYLLQRHGTGYVQSLADALARRSPNQIIGGTVGLLISLTLAFFMSQLFHFIQIPAISATLAGITYVVMGYLGIIIGGRMGGNVTLSSILPDFPKRSSARKMSGSLQCKVLDTSAIIDGRIVDIAQTGFLEGEIVIAEFVLKELRHIADSSDDLTRSKGRRGLDYIKELQGLSHMQVTITAKDYPEIEEVDLKLLKLASDMKGSVVTTDYNLNKVAVLQKIQVLNVNDLSNAVKPNAIPGERFKIEIIKRGKEADQGVGYLSDGTMIVVDKGKNRIGEELEVEVTSILQTPAGRMIFAKIKE